MKRYGIFLSALMLMFLSGCSGVNEALEEKMAQRSGVQEDSNYLQYQSYSEQGLLDENGYYSEKFLAEEMPEEVPPENTVHVTFADNNFLEEHYYSDSGHTSELTAAACYLPEGSRIYASVTLSKNCPSSSYSFTGFRIYDYSDDGSRELVDTVIPDETGLVLAVAGENIGREFSVEPIGDYQSKEIFVRAYYVDESGDEVNVTGTWMVNDDRVTSNTIEVNPILPYIVSFSFDPKEYFYVSSEPQCFYSSNEDGIIIFEQQKSNAETSDFSVELQKYRTATVMTSKDRSVSVNGGQAENIKAGQSWTFGHLKYGDVVTILTDSLWEELDTCREMILQSTEPLVNGEYNYKYIMIVPQKGGEFAFDPTEYTYGHGTLTFICFGEEAETVQYLAIGSKIYYEARTSDDGYWLGEGTHYITVTTPEETRSQLEQITFIPKSVVTVQLPQPACGGRIEYLVNGETIDTPAYSGRSGETITMSFHPWEGWITKYTDGEIYTVTEQMVQVPKIQDRTIDSGSQIFVEDDAHKPKLEVVLSDSLGVDTQVGVTASGVHEEGLHYVDKLLRSGLSVVKDRSIGTEESIFITVGNHAVQAGTAVKIQVEMTGEDKSGNGTEKVSRDFFRLISDLAKPIDPVEIYAASEMGSSTVWYKSVKITVSLVDVMSFTQPDLPANSNLSVTYVNDGKNQVLKSGDILQGGQSVTVKLTPDSGYYISGKNVKSDIFEKSMDFRDYLEEINEILEKHPAEKYYYVTLAAGDDYGSCSYELDGEKAEGYVRIKAGQKLKLTYKITDSSYVIEGVKGILNTGILKNDAEKSATITLDETYDGKTIDRNTFGINVVKEG